MKVINLFGGPGTGKSTTAAGVFAELKLRGCRAELAREWPKGPVWDHYYAALQDQPYIFGKHLRDLSRFERGGVEVVVTDAPLLMSIIYGQKESRSFRNMVGEYVDRFDNFDVLLKRVKPFDPAGRIQNELDAQALDLEIRQRLTDYYMRVPADHLAAKRIVNAFEKGEKSWGSDPRSRSD